MRQSDATLDKEGIHSLASDAWTITKGVVRCRFSFSCTTNVKQDETKMHLSAAECLSGQAESKFDSP